MITSVFSVLLSISLINTGIVNNQPVSELNVPDTGFTQQTTLNSTESVTPSSDFEYFVTVQLPQIKERSTLEQERTAELEIAKVKAQQEALATIEQEKLRIQQEVARIQQAQAEETARQKAEQEKLAKAAEAKRNAVQAAQTVANTGNGDYESSIRNRCAVVGCNSDQIIRVMYCESGGRANAYNASSGASGLMQFMPATFAANSSRYGMKGASIWDPYAQIHVATAMFANGQAHQWSCK